MSWGESDTIPLGENDSLLDDDIEDIIPTSQPKSFQSTTSFELVNSKRIEETIPVEEDFSAIIDDTIPVFGSRTPELDPSPGYIPDTETRPKRKFNGSELTEVCHKKLLSDTADVKDSEDILSTQSFRLPCSPSIVESQLLSVVNETESQIGTPNCVNPASNNNSSNDILMSDMSITEIFMDDTSKGTVDIDSTKSSKIMSTDNSVLEIKISTDDSVNAEKKAIEDDILLTDSPLRFMESSATLPVLNSHQLQDELPKVGFKSPDRPGTNDTINANGLDFPPVSPFSKRNEELATMSTIPGLSGTTSSSTDQELEKKNVGTRKMLNRIISDGSDVQKHSTPENPLSKPLNIDESTSSIENVTPDLASNSQDGNKITMNFKLKLECEVEFDPEFKTVIKKTLKRVINLEDKPMIKKLPHRINEVISNSSDDKSKNRLSSSSSGSVFSDKANLPFKLPNKRISVMSSQTESSGSTDDLGKHIKICSRTCWINEYLIPMEMDEALQNQINGYFMERNESADSIKRKTPVSSQKPKSRRKIHQQTLSDVFESTNTEDFLSGPDSHLTDQNSEAVVDKKAAEVTANSNLEEEVNPVNKTSKDDEAEVTTEEKKDLEKSVPEKDEIVEEKKTPEKEVILNVESFSSGLAVFARWTDLRYYSGVLQESVKYDRWNVKFDDGTFKAIKEEFIIPTQWLKEGELVFAMAGERYESGKIKNVDRENDQFTVELDSNTTDLTVNKSDLCLTEVMAGIVKEKYPPLSRATPGPKAEIDFDNVVSGKRVREIRTPTRNLSLQLGSTSSKKRSATNKSKVNESGLDTPVTGKASTSAKKTDTPVEVRSTRRGRPKTEKLNDSEPNPEIETPVRSAGKGKGKTKSLINDFDASTSSPLPTVPEEPVPGPSGVKKVPEESTPGPSGARRGRKKKIVDVAEEKKPEEPEEPQVEEAQATVPETRKGKRKLKSTEPVDNKAEEEAPKKSKTSKGKNTKKR